MSESRTPARPATYEDILALPEHVVGEIIDGELFVSPRPAPRHTSTHSTIGGFLNPAYQHGRGGPGGWWILNEPELHFRKKVGKDVLVPDVAGWRRERMPALPEAAYFTLAPDWVCEVLSPSTETLDRRRKLAVYAREGVAHAWLVDPIARTLEVLRLDNGHWVIDAVHANSETVQVPPFSEITLALADWWAD